MDYWWPFELNSRSQNLVDYYKTKCLEEKVELDIDLVNKVDLSIQKSMNIHREDILSRGGLGYLCHAINGWGNFKFEDGTHILDEIPSFVNLNKDNHPYIIQSDAFEGDFHPFQTFAYSCMAGVSKKYKIENTNIQLIDLIKNSRDLRSDQSEDLGHFLYTVGSLGLDKSEKFKFNGEFVDIEKIMEYASEAHVYGHFNICRKTHLTEGICIASKMISGLESYVELAEFFLLGQLNILYPLGGYSNELVNIIYNKIEKYDREVLTEVKNDLQIFDSFENLIFYTGHIVELAGLSQLHGFTINQAEKNIINLIVNQTSRILLDILPIISFNDAFLSLSHYRRAITLIRDIELYSSELGVSDVLLRYTTGSQNSWNEKYSESQIKKAEAILSLNLFEISNKDKEIHSHLKELIDLYNNDEMSNDFPLRGLVKHFRKICPKGWPRSVHYELLSYDDKSIGIEIHLESSRVNYLIKEIKRFHRLLKEKYSELNINFIEGGIYTEYSLQILFSVFEDKKKMLGILKELIRLTHQDISELLENNRELTTPIRN